jgi:hemoglobin/transferrin/lactoferrin receptor protein
VQYSHGFRAPPYEDANIGLEMPLFNYRAIPNPDLKSESSDGLDAGIRWRGAEADFRLALFRTQYDDFIESKMRIGTDPISGRTLFQSQNIRATVIKGIEGGGSLRLKGALQNVIVDGSFYLARGENTDTGEALNSVGPGQLVTGISWAANDGKRSAKLQGIFTEAWSHLDQTSGELFQPPGYSIFDFYLTQHIGENLRVRLGLLNLTDKTYWRWSDVRGLSPTEPVIPYLSQAGRSLSVSVGMNWQ